MSQKIMFLNSYLYIIFNDASLGDVHYHFVS